MTGEKIFAFLGFEPRPILEPEEVEAAYRKRARCLHPDMGGTTSAFQELNTARDKLIDPAYRLMALLEIIAVPNGGEAQNKQPSPSASLVALSLKAAKPLNHLHTLLDEIVRCRTAVALAMRRSELAQISHEVGMLQEASRHEAEALYRRLTELDHRWCNSTPSNRSSFHRELSSLRCDFVTLKKLQTNLHEAATKIKISSLSTTPQLPRSVR